MDSNSHPLVPAKRKRRWWTDSFAVGGKSHGMGEKEGEAKPGDGGESAGALVAHSPDGRQTAHAR